MKYQSGNIGRTFLVKMEHGDDLLEGIRTIAGKEQINSAVVFMLGALQEASLVTGPQKPAIPALGIETHLREASEIIATGTLVADENGQPSLHIHGSLGREMNTVTGCLRSDAVVYLVVEVIIMELLGIQATRLEDPLLKVKTLNLD